MLFFCFIWRTNLWVITNLDANNLYLMQDCPTVFTYFLSVSFNHLKILLTVQFQGKTAKVTEQVLGMVNCVPWKLWQDNQFSITVQQFEILSVFLYWFHSCFQHYSEAWHSRTIISIEYTDFHDKFINLFCTLQ